VDRLPPTGSGPFTPTEPLPRVSVHQDDVTVEDASVVNVGPPPPTGDGRPPKTPRALLALMAAMIAIALYWWFSQTQRAEEVALNATVRKAIRKRKGDKLKVQLEVDKAKIEPPSDLLECLEDEPSALSYFRQLPKSHQNYFGNWIRSAKTEATRAARIARVSGSVRYSMGVLG